MVCFILFILPQLKKIKKRKKKNPKTPKTKTSSPSLVHAFLLEFHHSQLGKARQYSLHFTYNIPQPYPQVHLLTGNSFAKLPTVIQQRLLFFPSPVSFLHCPLRLTMFWFLLTISFKAFPVLPLPEPKASAIGFTLLLCKQPLLGTRPCSDHLLFGVNH